MTNTLYEISADFLAALDAMEVDPDTGELLNADQLDALSAAFDEKAEATALYIKNLTAFVGNVKAEEAALAERRKTAEKRVERLKDLLASSMLSVGRDKVETARTKIGFRKSTQVQIDDEGALPRLRDDHRHHEAGQNGDQEGNPGRTGRRRRCPGREPEPSDQVRRNQREGLQHSPSDG